jgi:hypothetical protein
VVRVFEGECEALCERVTGLIVCVVRTSDEECEGTSARMSRLCSQSLTVLPASWICLTEAACTDRQWLMPATRCTDASSI